MLCSLAEGGEQATPVRGMLATIMHTGLPPVHRPQLKAYCFACAGAVEHWKPAFSRVRAASPTLMSDDSYPICQQPAQR